MDSSKLGWAVNTLGDEYRVQNHRSGKHSEIKETKLIVKQNKTTKPQISS